MTRYEAVRDALAATVFTLVVALIFGLVALVVFSCATSAVRPVREGVRALDVGSEWHARDVAIANAQPTPGCYGRGTVWCACQYVCGTRWKQNPARRVWRPTVEDCNCAPPRT